MFTTTSGTHPVAGRFTSRSDFYDATLKRLGAILKEPLKMRIRNVIGGGDHEWAVVELIAQAECKNGLNYEQMYAWVVRFSPKPDAKVIQVRAYLDSALVKQAVEENECPSHRAPIGGQDL